MQMEIGRGCDVSMADGGVLEGDMSLAKACYTDLIIVVLVLVIIGIIT
jgi:hypothetical protein